MKRELIENLIPKEILNEFVVLRKRITKRFNFIKWLPKFIQPFFIKILIARLEKRIQKMEDRIVCISTPTGNYKVKYF